MSNLTRPTLLLLLLLAGPGSLVCQGVHAQTTQPLPTVRFEWVDPSNKFSRLEGSKPDIERAVTRQISRNAENVTSSLGTSTGVSCTQSVDEWLVRIEAEQRTLTYEHEHAPETWWRVKLDICVNDGKKARLVTRDDNRILYDFDDFPPFLYDSYGYPSYDDTTNLLSDLVTRVGQQLRQFGQTGSEAFPPGSGFDYADAIRQIRKMIEANQLDEARRIASGEPKLDDGDLNDFSDHQLLSFLVYHKMLGGLDTHLSKWGDASEASEAIEHLEQAQKAGYLLEDRISGGSLDVEMLDVYRLSREISTLLDLAGASSFAPTLTRETTVYVGDDVRVSVGYDSETHLTGEFLWNVLKKEDSAFSFEGWKGTDSAGGLKLNVHWLGGGRQGENTFDGKVRKLFLASDWNIYSDGKLTFGVGGERADRFWSAYASKSFTGERLLNRNVSSFDTVSSGVTDDLHRWTQTDTLTMTSEQLAHPYNWGVGFRFGRFISDRLLRLRGGLDYEFGDYSSSQLTASANLEKRFLNSHQGLSLRFEVLRKRGKFETDQNDVRLSLYWSWDFGEIFQTIGTAPPNCPVEADVEATWVKRALRNPAGHKRTVDYYRFERVSESLETTNELFNRGPDAVDDSYAVEADSVSNTLMPGVLENDSDQENDTLKIISFTQPRNGTVELEGNVFSYSPNTGYTGEDTFTYTIEDEYTTTPHEPGQSSTATVTIDVKSVPPEAVDDDYEVMKNSYENSFGVMQNDYHPNGDPISIVVDSVTSPTEQDGTVVATGTTISYAPATGFCGVDRFTYAIEDDKGVRSNTATVTVSVTNNPPVAMDDAAMTHVNTSIVIPVLANDSDPDGDPIEISETGPTRLWGTVVDNGNGTVTYTPYTDWWGVDTFQYTIVDDCGDTATATVTVDISNTIPPVVSPSPGG